MQKAELLIALLRREGQHSGVWFADKLLEAADALEQAERDRDRLQSILDSRPAINAGLPESYVKWSQGIYVVEALHAAGEPVQ